METELDLSIVVPVFNSSSVVESLVDRIEAEMYQQGFTFEIILVDDKSADDSWAKISKLAIEREVVVSLKLKLNSGQHNATIAGIEESSGAIIITMDDDLQHNPEDISLLVDKIKSGYDVAYGKFKTKKARKWRIIASSFNNAIASFLMQKPKDIYLSPFRAIKREVKQGILEQRAPFAYIDGILLLLTRNIACVSVSHSERYIGESNYSFKRLVRLWLSMVTSHSTFPLRLSMILGVFFAFTGLLCFLFVIIQKFTINAFPVGWSSLMSVVLILSGVQLLVLGTLGEYIARIFRATTKIPDHIVEKKIGAIDQKDK
jgi:undecaprenyl-phosphate 4-deoxy-4-formamido-L-arabinose transferase